MQRSKALILFEWICVFFGVLGMFITAHGDPYTGFIISTIASILFIIYNWITKQYGLVLMSFLYLIIEIYGIIHWSQ